MAITKRMRFEIFRRDNHTCQYCGAKAPEVVLHIDHIVPVALGGDDKPGNLVAACAACNSGKTSIQPDSPLVEGMNERAASYVFGMQDKMTRFRSDLESLEEYVEDFESIWDGFTTTSGTTVPKPADWKMSLFSWKRMGIPMSVYRLAVPAAMTRDNIRGDRFTYMCGIVWNMINQREIDYSVTENAAAVYTEWEHDELAVEAYEHGSRTGFAQGHNSATVYSEVRDFLRHHIDGTRQATQLWGDKRIFTTGVEDDGSRPRASAPGHLE